MEGIYKKVEDNYSGVGEFIYDSGNKYNGEILNGKRHGHGVYTDSSGNKYDGEWKDDKMINGIFKKNKYI